MAVNTGTSVFGLQTLIVGVESPTQRMSILITSRNQPPVRRLGYWWLYQASGNAVNEHYVVEEGILRSPGLYIPIRLPAFAPSARFRVDAEWSSPGHTWQVAIV